MEAIAVDRKRMIHSLLERISVLFDTSRHHAGSTLKKTDHYRAIGNVQTTQDIYGRAGKVDIYSSREMVEFYRHMSYGKDKPL